MNDLNVYKIAQIGGLALALIMGLLGVIGTYSMTLFVMYGILALVGVAIFYGARKLDEMARDRELDDQPRENRLR